MNGVRRFAAPVALGAVFAALWLPLGQLGYLYGDWPDMALGGGFACLFSLALLAPGASDRPDRVVLLLVLGTYMLHQFEEHGVDLLGQTYAFEAAINGIVGPWLGCPAGAVCPFDPQTLYLVNTILVWWLIASVAVLGRGSPLPELMAVSIMTVNMMTHIGSAILLREYNPGLGTALVLFLPVGVGATLWIVRRHKVAPWTVPVSLLYGIGLHLLIVAGIAAVYEGWIGPAGYGLILFAAASVPVLLARAGALSLEPARR